MRPERDRVKQSTLYRKVTKELEASSSCAERSVDDSYGASGCEFNATGEMLAPVLVGSDRVVLKLRPVSFLYPITNQKVRIACPHQGKDDAPRLSSSVASPLALGSDTASPATSPCSRCRPRAARHGSESRPGSDPCATADDRVGRLGRLASVRTKILSRGTTSALKLAPGSTVNPPVANSSAEGIQLR